MTQATLLLTQEEIFERLDLDPDFSNLSLLNSLNQTASDFLLKRTGRDWGKAEFANTVGQNLAKNTAAYWVAMNFYNDDEHNYQKAIDYSIADLLDILISEG